MIWVIAIIVVFIATFITAGNTNDRASWDV